MNKHKVSVIIPAYNEATRIGNVLTPCLESTLADEVIVVNDCSDDNTEEVVKKYPKVTLINNTCNHGKHHAMKKGVEACIGDIILFLDADLKNLTWDYIDELITPLINDTADMTISYRKKAPFIFRYIIPLEPCLSGERCLRKIDYYKVLELKDVNGFEIEMLMNKYFLENSKRIKIIRLENLDQTFKVQKYGFKGFCSEFKVHSNLLITFGLIEWLRQIYMISIKFHLDKLFS